MSTTVSMSNSTAVEVWRKMEQNAFPGSESLIRTTPSYPQPDFLSINSTTDDSLPSSSKRTRHLTGLNTKTCTPWLQKEYTNDIIDLHEEILHFYEYIRPSKCEYNMRLHVFEKIKGIILAEWPHAQVNVFGSFCTNLYLPTNDIDIVVTGEWVKLPLFTLEEAFLKADLAVEDSIVVLDKTAVPIIKFIDKETEVKVDISFNHVNGLYCVEQIRQYINQYSLLPPLMMVIKQYLSQRQLNEVYYGGINSYSLVLMIVSFFQLHPRGEPATNLGVLLIEFFELYGRQFNYTKVGISLLDGGCYFPKDMLDNGSEAGLLYIQDPLEPTENASRGCYGIMHVRQSFDHAFSILHKAILTRESSLFAKPSLLSRIIQINEEVHEYRDWVKSRWPSSSSPPPFYLPMPTIMSPIPLMSPPGPFIIVPNTFQEEHTTPVEANGERALVYS